MKALKSMNIAKKNCTFIGNVNFSYSIRSTALEWSAINYSVGGGRREGGGYGA